MFIYVVDVTPYWKKSQSWENYVNWPKFFFSECKARNNFRKNFFLNVFAPEYIVICDKNLEKSWAKGES